MALLWVWIAVMPTSPASGAHGIPGSPDFAYGGHLVTSNSPQEAVRLAANLNLDWLSLPLEWNVLAPLPKSPVDWSRYDPIFKSIARTGISVMVSLSHPPAWALTPSGPDPSHTANLLNQLIQRYPGLIQAIELFPAANTRQAWGAVPDAAAYLNLIKIVQSRLQSPSPKPVLVAGGLASLPPQKSSQDIDDLVFLQNLYDAGAAAVLQLISVDSSEITGQPLQNPSGGETRVLRHYEQVRQVMLKNNHTSGMIWITHLSVPSGKINPGEVQTDPTQQEIWLAQAYGQVRSQLYIGAAFYAGLNPSEDNHSLILSNGSYHPFYRTLRGWISQSTSNASIIKPGQAKEQPLLKKP